MNTKLDQLLMVSNIVPGQHSGRAHADIGRWDGGGHRQVGSGRFERADRHFHRRQATLDRCGRDGGLLMTEGDALGIVQQAIWLTMLLAGPVIGSAMMIGVGIAFFQALTQVQEMTLTFVPKIIAGFCHNHADRRLQRQPAEGFHGADIFADRNRL